MKTAKCVVPSAVEQKANVQFVMLLLKGVYYQRQMSEKKTFKKIICMICVQIVHFYCLLLLLLVSTNGYIYSFNIYIY